MNIHQLIKIAQKQKLEELFYHYGSKTSTAKALGVSRQVVNHWAVRGRVSAKYAIKVERVTNGEFRKQDLRPDVQVWSKEHDA